MGSGRRFRYQEDPLYRFLWRTRQRMDAGELDADLGTLLIVMGEDMARSTPGASLMLRAMQGRFLDLYGRLEDGSTADLLTHTRGVSQLDALHKSIRAAAGREGAGRKSSPFSPPSPERRSGPVFRPPTSGQARQSETEGKDGHSAETDAGSGEEGGPMADGGNPAA